MRSHRYGDIICGGLITVSLIATFILRIRLKLENERRDRLTWEKYQNEAAIVEPCDWVSRHLTYLFLNAIFLFLLASRRTLRAMIRKSFEDGTQSVKNQTSLLFEEKTRSITYSQLLLFSNLLFYQNNFK